ncbi:MAG: hypothetical protein HDQ99_14775 [Lachnospiraceae bacterium]|nr:hypothetical protein [Lachnospiraceae bacterium]
MEGVNMTAVIITAIICVTVIVLAKIGNGSKNADNKAQKKSTRQQSE